MFPIISYYRSPDTRPKLFPEDDSHRLCIKIYNNFRDNSPHFPLFPSWEGLGFRFPIPDSRFPTDT
ncbi:MAG: hypothetical protein F6J98_22020 [Moorea sp. SIO4G2]|uniref:hypothetical protein n=1 Tax=unclassified Moorena TaxID=2683338 RepID=UPI0013F898ED|nr:MULTISPECIES: hypothetical protein [unclassified Moorena]NEO11199.1 hypothetical protein [Moorena sp. SIO3E8]NEO62967.1 hypothetical protein [Moorena sp. SIO4G2]NEQ00134.1 hypothetical protein [Moorena sp. SIO3F7]